jgi:hypothetical protein
MLPVGLVSMSYYFAPENHAVSYMRFLLPLMLPAVLLGLVFTKDALGRLARRPGLRSGLIVVLFVVQGAWGAYGSLRELGKRYAFNDLQDRKVTFIRENVPRGEVVIGPLFNLEALDYEQEYRLYDSQLVHPGLIRGFLERFLADEHVQAGRWGRMHARLFAQGDEGHAEVVRGLVSGLLAQGRQVYFAGNEAAHEALEETLAGRFATTTVAELPRLEPRFVMLAGLGNPENLIWGELRITRVEEGR